MLSYVINKIILKNFTIKALSLYFNYYLKAYKIITLLIVVFYDFSLKSASFLIQILSDKPLSPTKGRVP
jgi:hypothetical protein